MPLFTGFGRDALPFYAGLAADNSRSYWLENKPRWVASVSDPLQALAEELAPEFGDAKIFRPHRDVRFSADKSPYKEQASMVVASPTGSLYFQVSLAGVFLAGGLYQPARDQLARFRELQDDAAAAHEMDTVLAALAAEGLTMGLGTALKTAPRGWPKDHPRIEQLRLTSLAVGQDLDAEDWLYTADCLDVVADTWRLIGRWNDWLARRIGQSTEPLERF